jgi:hypothetical protein|tara:strand:+ start:12836 stop:21664 length:8829 start_codon:yes stop_codon:yes gene_type:complete
MAEENLTFNPNGPTKPVFENKLEGMVDSLINSGASEAMIQDMVKDYKRKEYVKTQADLRIEGKEQTQNTDVSSGSENSASNSSGLDLSLPEAKDYDESAIDNAIIDYSEIPVTDEEKAKNETAATDYIDKLYNLDEKREEDSWGENVLENIEAGIGSLLTTGNIYNTGLEKVKKNAQQQHEFIKKKKDLELNARRELAIDNGVNPDHEDFEEFSKNLTQDQIKQKAKSLHLEKLNSATRTKNLENKLQDEVGWKENAVSLLFGGTTSVIGNAVTTGMPDWQKEKNAKADKARSNLDIKIKNHVEKQGYYVNNIKDINAKLTAMSGDDYKSKQKSRLTGIDLELKKISEGKYTTPSEVDEANIQMQVLLDERGGIAKGFEEDQVKFKALQDKSKEFFQDYKTGQKEGIQIGDTDKELNTYLDSIGRRYGIADQSQAWLGSAALSLAGGAIEGIQALSFAPVNFANENIDKIPDVFLPVLGLSNKYKKFNDKYGIGKFSDTLFETAEKLNNGVQKPKTLDDLTDGEGSFLLDLGEWAAHATASQLPNTALMYASGGASLYVMGLSAGGNKYKSMEDEMEEYANLPDDHHMKDFKYSFAQMYSTAMVTGTAEALSEKITLGQLEGVVGKFGKKAAARAGFGNYLKRNLFSVKGIKNNIYDPIEEGGTEVISQMAGNLADKYLSGNPDKMYNSIYDGVKESFVSGAWMSGVVYKAPLMGQALLTPFQAEGSRDELRNIGKEILSLEKQLEDNNLSVEAKDAIVKEIQDKVKLHSDVLMKDVDNIDKMTPEEKQALIDISKNQAELDGRKKAIEEDGEMSDDAKNEAISGINAKLAQYKSMKNNIISPYNEGRNDKIINKQIKKIKKQAKSIFGDAVTVEKNTADQAQENFDIFLEQQIANTESELQELEGQKGDMSSREYLDRKTQLEANVNEYKRASIEDAKYENGFIMQDPNTGEQKIIVNQDVAAKSGATNVASHEFLHAILHNTVKDNPAAAKVLGSSLIQELAKIDLDQVESSVFRKKLEAYRNDPESVQAEEIMTLFSDAVRTGDIVMPQSTAKKMGNVIRRVLQATGLKDIKFKDATDVYNFIGDYNASVDSAFGNKAMKKGATKGFEIGGALKTKLDNLVNDNRNKENAAQRVVKKASLNATEDDFDAARMDVFENSVQDMWNDEGFSLLEKAYLIANMYDPRDANGNLNPRTAGAARIKNMLYPFSELPSYNIYESSIIDSILNDPDSERSIRAMIQKYDQEMTDEDGNQVPLSGYIGSILSKRGITEKNWGVGKFIKEGTGFSTSIDDAKDITNEESIIEYDDRSTLLAALDAEGNPIISTESQVGIVGFLDTLLGTKLPDLTAPRGKNRSVSPFVAEIKKQLGEKNDIPHKAMLAMLGNNPAAVEATLANPEIAALILDVLPTTWLASNIPSAVEKLVIQEDGSKKWTTDHVGRTKGTKPGQVDFYRSTEEGPYKGMTDGKQKIRRNPNAAKDVDLVKRYIVPGNMTNIKRNGLDSMAMALGVELGIELLNKDFKEGGPLSDLFKGRQDLFNRVLSDNYKSEAIGQLERGMVKMSRNAEDGTSIDFIENVLKRFSDLDGTNKSTMMSEASMAELQSIPGQLAEYLIDTGVVDMFREDIEQAYGIPLKNSDWGEFDIAKQQFLDRTATHPTSIKAMAATTEALIDKLPPNLLRILGAEFFGFSKRLLDPAATKRDKNGKIIPGAEGEYAWLKRKFDAKVAQADNKIYGFEDAGVFQAGFGVMRRVETILNKPPLPGESIADAKTRKTKEIETKFGKEIASMNAANPKAVAYVLGAIAEVIAEAKPEKRNEMITGIARLLQGASSNGKGIRGLTTLGMIQIFGQDMSPSIDGKVNKKHPLYKEALAYAKKFPAKDKTIESQVIELLRQKGEHQDVSANVNRENMRSLLDHINLLVKYPNQKETILDGLDDSIQHNIRQYSQVQNVKVMSDTQDKALSSTSSLAYARMLIPQLTNQLANYVDTSTWSEGQGRGFVVAQIIDAISALKPTPTKTIVQREIQDKAITVARTSKFSKNPKGITVLDFDDTLATSKSLIEYTKMDGTQGTLTPAQYAKDYQSMLGEGTVFDFSQFNEVIDGVVAPLFQKALKLQGKFGAKDMFVLTARPAESAPAIFAFLQANGLNIPIENITGLANSTAEAKALWMLDKVGEGYNDFYFADDALQNVQAVDDVLEQCDVKRKVQQAKVKFSKNASDTFNDILEESEGVKSQARFSDAKAKKRGERIGKFAFFIPPSAEDFKGLIYKFLSPGKKGEEQLAWFNKHLMRPFARAMRDIDGRKQRVANEWRALKKAFPQVNKILSKTIPTGDFTYDTAVRVYLWNKAGKTIDGLSAQDLAAMVRVVESNPAMVEFANMLEKISNGYPDPGNFWNTETIASDLNNLTEGVNRSELLAEFIENRKTIFGDWVNGKLSGPNMNKIEAIYGSNFREALEDMIWRMENGSNRSFGSNRLVNRFANWVNNSVGAIMFLNMRSAVLQTLSTVNFINWEDNNPYQAAKAFANFPQFLKDFSTLWNSDMLRQRRSGLRTDVTQSELAEAASGSKNKVKAIFQYLLAKGFTPTQIADSFAIASGGASFYRNRIKKYLKEGLSQKEAEAKAFIDFQEIAEETQQSSRPDLISQQQASVLGRLILAFQNTPMQYARLTKKAIIDLVKGRGSAKANVSKIIYYGAVQNIIFSALQKALFAIALGSDEEDEKARKIQDKKLSIINSMSDSLLRGMGVGGAVVSTLKNMLIAFSKENKKGWNFDEGKITLQMLNLSPPVGSKVRKVGSGLKTYKYNREVIKEMPTFDIDNPMWQSIGNVVSGLTNLPLDRAIQKTLNTKEALNSENEAWQRVSLFFGWNTYDVDVTVSDVQDSKDRISIKKKAENKKKRAIKDAEKKKEKERLRKIKEASEVQCSAIKKRGGRCKNRTANKNKKCYAHQ